MVTRPATGDNRSPTLRIGREVRDVLNALLIVLAAGLVVSLVALVAALRRLADAREAKGVAEGAAANAKAQIDSQGQHIQELTAQLMQAQKDAVAAEQTAASLREQMAKERELLDEARAKFADTFKALAADALTLSTTEFRAQAEESMKRLYAAAQQQLGEKQAEIGKIVEPLSKAIDTYQTQVRDMADKQLQSEAAVGEQVRALSAMQQQLQAETHGLRSALQRPGVRGQWGQMALRRVVEMAGMTEHVFFEEQVSTDTDAGKQRPDMIIHLPENREIVVDAKAPMEAYLQAVDAPDEATRQEKLKAHASHVRAHVRALAAKDYAAQFPNAPDCIVCFLPAEGLYSAALETDPDLMEFAFERRVILAAPFTLYGVLRAVATSWQQAKLLANAQEIADESKKLVQRMGTFVKHLGGIHDGLHKATDAYNSAAGSWERMVAPQGRRVLALQGASEGDMPEMAPVEEELRHLPPGAEVEADSDSGDGEG